MAEKRSKPRYSTVQNVSYLLKSWWAWSRARLLFNFLLVPAEILLSLLGIAMAPAILNALSRGVTPMELCGVILAFTAGLCACTALKHAVEGSERTAANTNRLRLVEKLCGRIMTCDYAQLEDAEARAQLNRAFTFVRSNHSGGEEVVHNVVKITLDAVGLVFYGAMLCTLTPWLLVLLAGLAVVSFLAGRHAANLEYRDRSQWTVLDEKLDYLYEKPFAFEAGKDLRLYSIGGWFESLFSQVLGERSGWERKTQARWYAVDALQGGLNLVRDGAAYALLLVLVLNGTILAADFVFYFGVVGGFSAWMTELIEKLRDLTRCSLECCEYRAFLEAPDDPRAKAEKTVPVSPGKPASIVFDHVSFRYPGAQKDAVHDLSFSIHPGEKVALVGLNGAGKTTCVKLLCGLYTPTAGKIFLNGVDLAACNRDAVFDAITAVFQDVHFLPVSIAQNVAAGQKVDRARVQRCLELSGLWERVSRLPDGMDTPLEKTVNENAAAFSGGEQQKLVLARALYKDAPLILLDEPTAALDPIAENEMYQKYGTLTEGRTSVFISHRLSSTRFCDRILFLKGGKITEEGTHDALLQQGGDYAYMFKVQSHYYENANEREAADLG